MAPVTTEPELETLRTQIDDLDARILGLIAQRVGVVMQIAEYKLSRGLPVYDAERETRLINRLCELRPPPLDAETVRRIYERLIDESRRLEQRHLTRSAAARERRRG
ncbi:MAG: chorismate mutase [Polyangiaceae bacterium]|nr:chorismate mutase [Polyangiaceae bacterium]